VSETQDHRERRLLVLAGALEKHLDEGWLYFLVIGKPGDPDSTNMVCNAPLETNEEVLKMLKELTERYSKGLKPQKLE
jgi:serine protease inhibitor ecotin